MFGIASIFWAIALILGIVAILFAVTGKPWTNLVIGAVIALVIGLIFGVVVH